MQSQSKYKKENYKNIEQKVKEIKKTVKGEN